MSNGPRLFAAMTTTVHPFALYFPGNTTTMGLAWIIHRLFGDDPNTVVYDEGGWLLPMGILFARDVDRLAFEELLHPSGFTFIEPSDSGIHIAAWNPNF